MHQCSALADWFALSVLLIMSWATALRPTPVSDDTTEHWCARIRGHLQGAGYCDACVQAARQIGLAGWARNRKDGSVEVELHGSVEQLLAMRQWLGNGPVLAEVRSIEWRQVHHPGPAAIAFHRRLTV